MGGYLVAVVLVLSVVGCSILEKAASVNDTGIQLFSAKEIVKWENTPTYHGAEPWRLVDDAFQGQASWVGHPAMFDDFVLECEVLFLGKGEGGIVVRGDRTSNEPWKSGYEIDIDGDEQGGQIAVWSVDEGGDRGKLLIGHWHEIRVQAQGEHVTVALDGTQVIEFNDAAHARGNLCLEDHNESVKYRNLVVTPRGKWLPTNH